jgi:hypothetical protein
MKYTDGFKKIETPFSWVNGVFEEVFNGENTDINSFYKDSCENLINEQEKNYNNAYGTYYYLTNKQKSFLKNKWDKLKLKRCDIRRSI